MTPFMSNPSAFGAWHLALLVCKHDISVHAKRSNSSVVFCHSSSPSSTRLRTHSISVHVQHGIPLFPLDHGIRVYVEWQSSHLDSNLTSTFKSSSDRRTQTWHRSSRVHQRSEHGAQPPSHAHTTSAFIPSITFRDLRSRGCCQRTCVERSSPAKTCQQRSCAAWHSALLSRT